jgi:hypothetical protein
VTERTANCQPWAWFGISLAVAACGVDQRDADGDPRRQGEPPAYLTALPTQDDFAAVSGEGAEVKYLATVDGREPPPPFGNASCLFQNTRDYPYHLHFLRTFPAFADLSPERYADLVLRRDSRSMWGGGLKLFAATLHPRNGDRGVLAYTVYSDSTASELLTASDIVEVDRKLKSASSSAADWLVFTPDGTAQLTALPVLLDELDRAGVSVAEPSMLEPGLAAETYSEGESYGYLRLVPEGDDGRDASPRDVLVVDSAPADLSVVAGVVTRNPQSVASHLNLRLREKGIPNASAPAVFESPLLATFADRLVRFSARDEEVILEPAHLDDAEAFWQAHHPTLGEPRAELDVAEPAALESLEAVDAAAFGAKAANLGELSRALPIDHTVRGFALPFRLYVDFVAASGLDAEIEALLADREVRTDAGHKRARLDELRASFRATDLSDDLARTLERTIRDTYGDTGVTTRLRFRSSTNAEDLPGHSGAGLYDSRSGCLGDDLDDDNEGPSACLTPEHEAYLRAELERREAELAEFPERAFLADIIEDLADDLTEEKSASLALRRVWASLWNERAFDDREYYGLHHHRVFMGVAVHPTFVGERLEAVVLTNLEPGSEEPLYRVVSQVGEIGVVDPADPGARPEIITFRRSAEGRATAVELVQASSLVADGERLWAGASLEELAGLLFAAHDHFAANVYGAIAPLTLDLEVDMTMDGRTVVKQARPYTP